MMRKRRSGSVTAFILALGLAMVSDGDVVWKLRGGTARAETAAAAPELPRVYLNTTYVPPTGQTIAVPAGGDFQAAINQAQPGDVITLQAGATYTGNFTLPAKTGTGWVIIRTSAPDSALPAPGTRITPSYASVLPKIVTPNVSAALEAVDRAHHYRFIGVEITAAASAPFVYNLVVLGDKQTSLSQVPNNLIFDRVFIHGRPGFTLRRGIALNSASTSVIDSYISDCHEVGADSQAIGGWNSPGPLKIVNNYLEGAGENFILGGADPTIPNLVPSDIEFRRNYCFKPLTWRIGDPSYAGTPWGVKNLFELKNAQRVLIDGNIFEQNWAMAQNGFAILFTVRNQDGAAPWSTVQDVTFTNNIVRRSGSGVNMHGTDDLAPSQPTSRIKMANNLFDQIDGTVWVGSGIGFLFNGGPNDVIIDHNTVINSGSVIVAGGTAAQRMVYTNNISPHNEYGVFGDSLGTGNSAINFYFPGVLFKKNILSGGQSAFYPADNFFPATLDQVGFIDRANRNFRLSATSPYKNAGTDGKDLGCDFDALNQAINGGGLEADVSPRPTGDGVVNAQDWAQMGKFVSGMETPSPGNEFQRADCAPRGTSGDGKITIADWVQAGRYAVGLDPVVSTAGSSTPAAVVLMTGGANLMLEQAQSPRELRAVSRTVLAGGDYLDVPIRLMAQGGESVATFTLNHNPAVLSYQGFASGADAGTDATILVNPNSAFKGQLGLGIMLKPGRSLEAGDRELIIVRFKIIDESAATTVIRIGGDLAALGLSDIDAGFIPVKPVAGKIRFVRPSLRQFR